MTIHSLTGNGGARLDMDSSDARVMQSQELLNFRPPRCTTWVARVDSYAPEPTRELGATDDGKSHPVRSLPVRVKRRISGSRHPSFPQSADQRLDRRFTVRSTVYQAETLFAGRVLHEVTPCPWSGRVPRGEQKTWHTFNPKS